MDESYKEPTNKFLLELAKALRKAEHRNVAEHMAAGMLFAIYPEWFEKCYVPSIRGGLNG
jgi:hypothetical protein